MTKANVEVRKAGNELLPLLVLGLTSMALVGGMAYAVQAPDTATSIARTAKVVFAVLGGGILAMVAVALSRGRPFDAVAEVTDGGVFLVHGGKRRAIPPGFRTVYVIRDGDRWSVEIERRASVLRLLAESREEAEAIAGALAGTERIPAALYRLRKKAEYALFVSTCTLWVFVYAGLVALPEAPIFGVLFTLALLPPTIWVTLKAVPTQLVVAPYGLMIIDTWRVRQVPTAELVDGRVVDDDAVRITFTNGASLKLTELADHPRDREAKTSSPPAERFEASLQQLLRPAA
ncbi:hypothetical protein [Vulgatibacter sp.]|uniref:hypothetical protein n=1 Tax=Vulgatibacter sp. TaxID=1971226 RepID=UPI003569FDAF